MLRTKALVIGGGPAGSTAARFLAKEGIDTILIERNPSFVKPCGGAIPSGAFDELSIPKKGIKKKIQKIMLVSPKGEVVNIGLKGGFVAIVQRGEFDSILRDEAKNSEAKLIEAELKNIEEKGRNVIAKVDIRGREESIETDYLIAADGVNSRVRFSLGIKLQNCLYTLLMPVRDMDSDTCEFWFGSYHAPNSYSWIFPTAEGVSIGTGSNEPKILRSLMGRFFERRELEFQSSARMYKIPLWDGALYNKNNIFFVGDAAGHVMPLTYEGIYHAMKAGEFAARAVIAEKPLEYKKLWRKRFYSRFMIMKKLTDYFLKDDKSAEKLISLYRDKEIQDVSMRLWLEKSSGRTHLISFMNFFRRVMN